MLIPVCTAAGEHDLPIYFFGTSAPVLEASIEELSLLGGGRLRDLRASLSRVSQQKAALEAQMLPGHPAVRVAIDNERKIMTMIDGEVRRIRESSDVELRRARANAVALEKQLETLRGQVNRTNNAQIQLRELEREVEMNRNLFQQAVTRAREATEQARVNTTNVRVISPANAERDRVFPPPLSFLALFGLGLGALGSMMLSFLREITRRHGASA
jgi:uncharacterized protein involved in exopolysaccharide biosynthesis